MTGEFLGVDNTALDNRRQMRRGVHCITELSLPAISSFVVQSYVFSQPFSYQQQPHRPTLFKLSFDTCCASSKTQKRNTQRRQMMLVDAQSDAFSVSKCSVTLQSHGAGGKLFHTEGPLKAILRCLFDVCTRVSWMHPVDAGRNRGRLWTFLATFAICYGRPSGVCLSSVTFVRPTQAVQIFGNISTAIGTLAIR